MDVKGIDWSELDQHICFKCLSIGPRASGGPRTYSPLSWKKKERKKERKKKNKKERKKERKESEEKGKKRKKIEIKKRMKKRK